MSFLSFVSLERFPNDMLWEFFKEVLPFFLGFRVGIERKNKKKDPIAGDSGMYSTVGLSRLVSLFPFPFEKL